MGGAHDRDVAQCATFQAITVILSLSHNYPHPAFRPQRDQRLRFDRSTGDQLEGHALDEHGEDQMGFHHGEVIADADVWACAEGEISIAVELRFVLRCSAVGVEMFWGGEGSRVAVEGVWADANVRPWSEGICTKVKGTHADASGKTDKAAPRHSRGVAYERIWDGHTTCSHCLYGGSYGRRVT